MKRWICMLSVAALLVGDQVFFCQTTQAAGTVTNCNDDSQLQSLVVEGGTINFACPGTGVASINLSTTLTIDAATPTVIDGGGKITLSGQNSWRLFAVNGTRSLHLKNITLTKGYSAGDGGAIFNSGSLTIENTLIEESNSDLSGGALVNYGPLAILNSTIRNNRALSGGGIYLRFPGGSGTVTNSRLENNTAASTTDGWGGGVLLWDGATLIMDGGEINANIAREGGGINNRFPNSTITLNGGLRVIDNRATAGNGGGVYSGGSLQIDQVTFSRNWGLNGGAIDQTAGQLTISTSLFQDNQARILNNTNLGTGGAINAYSPLSLSIGGTIFSGNKAASGGAIHQQGGKGTYDKLNLNQNYSTNYGAGMSILDVMATLSDSNLSGNQSDIIGGGAYFNQNAIVTVTGSTISGNQAVSQGGGIYSEGTATLQNVTLSGNSTGSGGGYNNYGSLTMLYVTIAENTAGTGGGLYHELLSGLPQPYLSMQNVMFSGNIGQGGYSNCYINKPVAFSLYSLSSDASCLLSGSGTANNAFLPLGPLVSNGGVTPTRLPLNGSRSIDGGQCLAGITVDQRGVSRPQGIACDVGAVEYRPGELTPWLFLPFIER